jgi:formate dehydrogenase subunit gamma
MRRVSHQMIVPILLVFCLFILDAAVAQDAATPNESQAGTVPGGAQGTTSDSDFWRQVRQGDAGNVSIADKKSGILIQSEGDNWRAIRNGPLSTYGIWVILGMIILLAIFFALRGRVRIEEGPANVTIKRFNGLERTAHWVMAVSFVILAITGLNILYGRYVLPPVIGKEAFAAVTMWGKYAHNYVAFAFMAGLAAVFLLWVLHNFPNRHDVVWLLKGGGLFSKGVHPPARKFNAGQKIIFWITILGGLSLSLSGWELLDPFQYQLFAKTFVFMNSLGFNLPTDLTPIQEQQLAQMWHSIVGLVMTAIILAHIYVGSLGIEGAFSAMGSGQVDLNWAKQHHNIWVEEVQKAEAEQEPEGESRAPAE